MDPLPLTPHLLLRIKGVMTPEFRPVFYPPGAGTWAWEVRVVEPCRMPEIALKSICGAWKVCGG